MDKKRIDAATFVQVWQESNSVAEVATRTGLAHSSAAVRAVRLRRRGVRLKHMRPGRGPFLDVAALNAIIDDKA